MLIPWGSDAPLYHLPIATGGMILANVAAYAGVIALGSSLAEEEFYRVVNELILTYGNGLRPWQWITSNFMHADLFHLLGNMFCLWGFGMVVEGKIGWWRFLLIYFGIGFVQCGVEQSMMLFASEGGSLGASAVIYGLLAICMIWAPQNEMNCLFFLFFRFIAFDATLYTIAVVAIIIQVATGMFAGLSISSQVLHLMGAAAGLGVGIVMLKKGWVDCEGWDLFSVWKGTNRWDVEADKETEAAAAALLERAHQQRAGGKASAPPQPAPQPSARFAAAGELPGLTPAPDAAAVNPLIAQMRAAVAAGQPRQAFACYQQFAADPLNWPLPEQELLQTIALYHKARQWSASVPAMVAYLKSFTTREAQVRLKLAHVLIEADQRPGQALAVLGKLNVGLLSDAERTLCGKLRARAERLRADHPQEVIEDWDAFS